MTSSKRSMRATFATLVTIAFTVFAGLVSATSVHAAAPTYDHYVALGDSYTAGPFIPGPRIGALGCTHSTSNYPAFLASHLQVETFTDVSCAGARSHNLYDPQPPIFPDDSNTNGNAPQLFAVTKNTDLVTLGMGGNDFGLFGDVIERCARAATEHPDAFAPCKKYFTKGGVDTKMRDAAKIQGRIEKNIASIREKAPNAKIVVIGYLDILPPSSPCPDVPFAAGDIEWGNAVEKALNKSIRDAAAKFGATYVGMFTASRSHDACAGSEAWVNGSQIKFDRALSFHPFAIGMRGIAQTTYRTITGETATAEPKLKAVQRLPGPVDVAGLRTWLASPAGAGGLPTGTPSIPGLTLSPSATPTPDDSGKDGASRPHESSGPHSTAGASPWFLILVGLGAIVSLVAVVVLFRRRHSGDEKQYIGSDLWR